MVSVIIKERHIGDLASLYYKKNIRAFLRREQDFSKKKKGNSPALNSAPQKKL